MDPEQVAEGLQKLEIILNEDPETIEQYRKEIVEDFVEDVVEQAQEFNQAQKRLGKIRKKRLIQKYRADLEIEGSLNLILSDHHSIIGRGEHQIVLDLENGLVAKLPYCCHKKSERFFDLGGGLYQWMNQTIDGFSEIKIEIPEIVFYRFILKDLEYKIFSDILFNNSIDDWMSDEIDYVECKSKTPNICITPDLRENGRYNVIDYNEEIAEKLVNGQEIISQVEGISQRLKGLNQWQGEEKTEPGIVFDYNFHALKTDADDAIKRMFLLQIPKDPKEEGRVVVGDVDHIFIYHWEGEK